MIVAENQTFGESHLNPMSGSNALAKFSALEVLEVHMGVLSGLGAASAQLSPNRFLSLNAWFALGYQINMESRQILL
jgi:hypothetical protein